MITVQTLKENSLEKFSDSRLLFKKMRYNSSLYLIGYAVEMALKLNICNILKLDNGFPETKEEFDIYISQNDNDLGNEIRHLSEIRNHNLQKLLFYSGKEYIVKAEMLEEWTDISFWTPELRYHSDIGDMKFNEKIVISVEKLLSLILN